MAEPNHDCRIMVFRPTMEEFKDFNRYIHYMESQGAHRGGIAKVIPPKEWVPQRSYDNIDNFVIPAPISQVVTGQKGLFTQYNIQKKPMTVKEFRRLTNTPRYEPPFHENYEELERMFWKNITFNPPIYGADISGSLYDEDVDEWNVSRLDTLLDVIELDSGVKIEGVNTAYLYFGMWKTTFAWHTEDMDLYSINYVHFGAPKSWYSVPPEHGKRLERLASGFFPNSKSNCVAFLRHKMTMISPTILKQYGIPVNKITQEAGQFIITFPYGYHSGFNHGFNCAESTNFASERWVDYGRNAEKCICRNDTVTIDMNVFVEIFQPDQYEEWKSKKNEVKLAYNEIPPVPDFKKPYPSWKVKVDEYRSIHGSVEFIKKKLILPRKPTKPKDSSETTPSKSQSKQKIKSPKSAEKKATSSTFFFPLEVSLRSELSNPDTSTSQSGMDTPECKLLQGHASVFDRVKSGARRMSSARAISFMDELPSGSSASDSLSSLPHQTEKNADTKMMSDCSVKCEPLSSLSLEIVGQETFILNKDRADKSKKDRSNLGIKRRHPVVRKGVSKKSCSNVLLQKENDTNPSGSTSLPSPSSSSSSSSLPSSPESRASFKEERDYNSNLAKLVPHCAVCLLFKPYFSTPVKEIVTSRGLLQNVPTAPPDQPAVVAGDRTQPLIPEVSFASSVNHPSPLAVCRLLGGDGKSTLLQCCVCLVQVHASCYGVESPPKKKAQWTCQRCMSREWNTQCTLCCIKGGALKRISGGHGWAHIVCAIAIPEVFFDDTAQRKGINVTKVTLSRLKLKCHYCQDSKVNQASGVCLQCCACRCAVSFHTTCAHAAGIPIEAGNWPFPVYVHCREHSLMKVTGLEGEQGPLLEPGQSVVAKHKNGKYYHGKVNAVNSVNFYKVNFKDNSWSDNLYQQDIVDHDWSSGESPEVGSLVQVKWTDGDLYEAEYRGNSVHQIVEVKFDDGSLVELERENIFAEGEPIPAKIRRKLAKSSIRAATRSFDKWM